MNINELNEACEKFRTYLFENGCQKISYCLTVEKSNARNQIIGMLNFSEAEFLGQLSLASTHIANKILVNKNDA